MNKKEIILDPESNNSTYKVLHSLIFTHPEEELKTIQRLIALLRQDLPKIIHGEWFKFQNQKKGDMY